MDDPLLRPQGKGRERPPTPPCQRLPEIYFDCSSNENSSGRYFGRRQNMGTNRFFKKRKKNPQREENFKAIQQMQDRKNKKSDFFFQRLEKKNQLAKKKKRIKPRFFKHCKVNGDLQTNQSKDTLLDRMSYPHQFPASALPLTSTPVQQAAKCSFHLWW